MPLFNQWDTCCFFILATRASTIPTVPHRERFPVYSMPIRTKMPANTSLATAMQDSSVIDPVRVRGVNVVATRSRKGMLGERILVIAVSLPVVEGLVKSVEGGRSVDEMVRR